LTKISLIDLILKSKLIFHKQVRELRIEIKFRDSQKRMILQM
jgi:hypothetical protein